MTYESISRKNVLMKSKRELNENEHVQTCPICQKAVHKDLMNTHLDFWEASEGLKVAFVKKVRIHLSFPQTAKPHYFPELEF